MSAFGKRATTTWRTLVNAGHDKITDARQAKYHRIANRLLIAIVFINLWLNCLEIFAFGLLLQRDAIHYKSYFLAYGGLSTVLYFMTVLTFYLKNRTGNMKFAFLIVLSVVGYVLVLSLFLGPKLMLHLVFFALMPIPFFIHTVRQWRSVVLHEIVIIGGLAGVFIGYAHIAPLYPLPADLEPGFFLAALFTAIAIMIICVYVMWRQSDDAETQLGIEKHRVETLLEETIPKLESAEAKYRNLVEGTNDIVFSMKIDGTILAINRAIKKHLGYTVEEMIGSSIYRLLVNTEGAAFALERELLQESIQNLVRERSPVMTRATFAGKYAREPVEFSLKLEYTPSASGTEEILGKAVSVHDDLMLKFLHRERGSYSIGNLISHADLLSQKLTRNLAKLVDASDAQAMRISLREMLINAIEHGNLNITFDEKTRAQANGDFLEYLAQRRKSPEFAERTIRVDYVLSEKRIAYRITDEGPGFNHAAILAATNTANDDFLAHGRGIGMTRSLFDVVRYNDKGNEVVLIKYVAARNSADTPR